MVERKHYAYITLYLYINVPVWIPVYLTLVVIEDSVKQDIYLERNVNVRLAKPQIATQRLLTC